MCFSCYSKVWFIKWSSTLHVCNFSSVPQLWIIFEAHSPFFHESFQFFCYFRMSLKMQKMWRNTFSWALKTQSLSHKFKNCFMESVCLLSYGCTQEPANTERRVRVKPCEITASCNTSFWHACQLLKCCHNSIETS